jgi:hypothetical protein
MDKIEGRPHASRGELRNGNLPGDFLKAPPCGAKTRRGIPCQTRAMANGRCRMHGGLSTGPQTAAGIERIRNAVTKHGRFSHAAKEEAAYVRSLIRAARSELARICER